MRFSEIDRERTGAELHLVSTEGLWELRTQHPRDDAAVILTWRMWPHGEIARFPLGPEQDPRALLARLVRTLESVDEGAWGWEVALSLAVH